MADYLAKYRSLWKPSNSLELPASIESLVQELQTNYLLRKGPAAHYLLDYKNQRYLFISESVKNLLGFSNQELIKGGIPMQFELMHPDDAQVHLNFSLIRFRDFLMHVPPSKLVDYKFSYNYRMKRKDGQYFHMLQEFVILEKDSEGLPLYNFGYATDISRFKSDNKISFRVSRYDDEKGFTLLSEDYFPGHLFSQRELEVIRLAAQGINSKQIAEKLSLTVETIKSHRKKILAKTDLSKFIQVIEFARNNGLL